MPTIGVVDTTFSRVNMGAIACKELAAYRQLTVIRRTVPGIKDLGIECKRVLDGSGADVCLALGMVGAQPIDKQCANEASLAIQTAKMMTGKHILEVFVHEEEGEGERGLYSIFQDRTKKHAHNAARLLLDPEWFVKNAGKGLRQGRSDAGGLL